MATKKKDRTKVMTETVKLPRGITRDVKKSGAVRYVVTAGTGKRRKTARFEDLGAAKRYQDSYWAEETERIARGMPALSKEEHLAQTSLKLHVAATGADSGVKVVPVMGMIDSITEKLARDHKEPHAIEGQARILKRFLADKLGREAGSPRSGDDFIVFDEEGPLELDEDLDDDERKRVGRYYRREMKRLDALVGSVQAKADSIEVVLAEELPEWLCQQNYGKRSASTILKFAIRIWAKAVAYGHVRANVFDGLRPDRGELPRFDRKGNDRDLHLADALTVDQLVTIARLLRDCYLLPFWLCVTLGMRRSEVFGLTVADWIEERGDLYLKVQRKSSPQQGTTTLKRADSNRPLPVPRPLAEALDQYVLEVHGEPPHDEQELKAWRERYLIVGAKGGPMNPSSFADAVRDAALAAGMSPQIIGYFRPVHHLRKTLGAYLQATRGLAGRAISVLLGHKVDGVQDGKPAARVTQEFYNPVIADELYKVVAEIEVWFDREVFPALGSSCLLDVGGIEDPMTLETATRLLSSSGVEISLEEVFDFVQAGEIRCTKLNHTNDLDKQRPVVSEGDVQQVLRNLLRSNATTYCAAEVADILATDHRAVYRLAAAGHFTEVTVNPRARKSATGNRYGMLPGGGRRFLSAEVDAFAEQDAERIHRVRTWLKIGETADLLGTSTDTVRRMADAGELVVWRDPRSRRLERYICPVSANAHYEMWRSVSYEDAATALDVSVRCVTAMLKIGDLKPGLGRKTVLWRSVIPHFAGRNSLGTAA